MIVQIQVRRDALAETRKAARDTPLDDGQAAFAVEQFALTANNMTYAAHGVDMRYWDFFPAPEGWGIVPVWGFARCTESRAEGVAFGDRFYGYWPMADAAVLTPVKVAPRGFIDGAAHRRGLPSVYNGYARVTPAMGDESVYALFRPLFLTSFLLDAAFAGKAETFVISSASSKTALGLAQAAKARGGARIIGLTSARNRAFVESTGYYDSVATYEAVGGLSVGGSVAYADFAGDGALRADVHARYGAEVALSLVIGDTHWETSGTARDLPGARPEFFFAPTVLQAQLAELGQAGFDARVESAWAAFTASTAPWLRLVAVDGVDAARAAWTRLAGGGIDLTEGMIVRLGAPG